MILSMAVVATGIAVLLHEGVRARRHFLGKGRRAHRAYQQPPYEPLWGSPDPSGRYSRESGRRNTRVIGHICSWNPHRSALFLAACLA